MTDTITLPRAVVEQALEALDESYADTRQGRALADALRAALEQPQVEQEPAAEVTVSHVLPDLEGRCTAEIASCERLPVGAELFIHPQNLRCKSNQARLATLWGYVEPQPQGEQEPVAMLSIEVTGPRTKVDVEWNDPLYQLPSGNYKLYTHPQPKRAPLKNEQIRRIESSTHFHESRCWAIRFARAIEAAHGIGGEA